MRTTKREQNREEGPRAPKKYLVIIDKTGHTQIYARHIPTMSEYGLWQICCKWFIQISQNGTTTRKRVPDNIKKDYEQTVKEIFTTDNLENEEIYRVLQQIWLNA